MKCPCCGAAKLLHDSRDTRYTYQGPSAALPAVAGDFCPVCGDVLLSREHGDRHIDLVGVFQHQLSAGYSALP